MVKRKSHSKNASWGAGYTYVRALLVCACLFFNVGALAGVGTAPLRVVWQLLPSARATGAEPASPAATLSITNTGVAALPSGGWSLWFTCMAGVQVGPAGEAMVVEKAAGTLYRLHPVAGFTGLLPGGTVQVPIVHDSDVGNPGKGPDGVFFSFDATPSVALAVRDFVREPMPDEPRYVTAEGLYERYAARQSSAAKTLPPVFPAPREWNVGEGQLRWSHVPRVEAGAGLEREAASLRELLAVHLAASKSASGPPVRLLLAEPGSRLASEPSDEAYELSVDAKDGVIIRGRTAAGVAYGISSLHELLPVIPSTSPGVALPALVIRDAPRFAYRGLMLDVARNFQPVSEVRRVLSLMARYKLNKLHLHLTDDEGWRIEIRGLPELTAFGGRRGPGVNEEGHLMPAHGSGADIENAYASGHYTRGDYQAILRAAAALHIEVIPEIEMPGHARAAVKAMAWRASRNASHGEAKNDVRLDDPQDASAYESAQLYSDNVMNPALPSTYRFIEHVVADLVAMHREAGVPLRTLQVGGDELPSGAWRASPAVKTLMAQNDLHERADVWKYFYSRVSATLAIHGVEMGGWQEISLREPGEVGSGTRLETAPPAGPPATWVWNTRSLDQPDDGSTDIAVRLANAGTDVVLSPASRYYFDLMHTTSPVEPGHDWAGHTDLDTVFDFVPFDPSRADALVPTQSAATEPLTRTGRAHVRGLEGTLFSELVHSPGRLDYLLLPRLLALAERAWSPDPAWATEPDPARAAVLHRADWMRFAAQVGTRVLPRLDAEHSGWQYRIPPPGLQRQADGVHAISALPGLQLRYTNDGSTPTQSSPTVDGPIKAAGTITVAAFTQDGRSGPSSTIYPTNH